MLLYISDRFLYLKLEGKMGEMFDKTIDTLRTSMNFRLLRQNLVSSNIANGNTPEYKALRLEFEKALKTAVDIYGTNSLSTSDDLHFPTGVGDIQDINPRVFGDPDVPINNDGNTVNVDKEMAVMAKNALMYNASAKLINKKLALMKYAVLEGGK